METMYMIINPYVLNKYPLTCLLQHKVYRSQLLICQLSFSVNKQTTNKDPKSTPVNSTTCTCHPASHSMLHSVLLGNHDIMHC